MVCRHMMYGLYTGCDQKSSEVFADPLYFGTLFLGFRVARHQATPKRERRMRQTCSNKTEVLRGLGCGAAALSGLFACSQADADIVHSGAGNATTVGTNSTTFGLGYIFLDIDNNGAYDFQISVQGSSDFGYFIERRFNFSDNAQNTNFWIAGEEFSPYSAYAPAQLQAGATIGRGHPDFENRLPGVLGDAQDDEVRFDPWGAFAAPDNRASGFVGVQFEGTTAGGGTGSLFGWVQIALDTTRNDVTISVLDYAYENMGNPIEAGAVPTPSALALAMLACGSAGMRGRRTSA